MVSPAVLTGAVDTDEFIPLCDVRLAEDIQLSMHNPEWPDELKFPIPPDRKLTPADLLEYEEKCQAVAACADGDMVVHCPCCTNVCLVEASVGDLFFDCSMCGNTTCRGCHRKLHDETEKQQHLMSCGYAEGRQVRYLAVYCRGFSELLVQLTATVPRKDAGLPKTLKSECESALLHATAMWAHRAKMGMKPDPMQDDTTQGVPMQQDGPAGNDGARAQCPWHARGLRCQLEQMYNCLRGASKQFCATHSRAFWCMCDETAPNPAAKILTSPLDEMVGAWMLEIHDAQPRESTELKSYKLVDDGLGKRRLNRCGLRGRGRGFGKARRMVF
jgi:hypothetical protein